MLINSLLVALSALAASPETPPSEVLTIMSYNLRTGTADDGLDAWDLRKDFLVETVTKHNPTILGTQECLDFQADYLAEKLDGYGRIGLGRDADGGGEMMAVLYQKSRLLPLESGHFWLSETPEIPASKSWDSNFPRIATWVKFFDRTTQRHFYFYNTHFDHRGVVARQESARLLQNRIATLHSDVPVVLTGDFNAKGGDSEPWTTLTSGNLMDLWDAAKEQKGVPNTSNGFKIPDPERARRIDWILATKEVIALSCEIDAVHREGRFPSDHMPVIARIALPK
jgi:endonuclease/exonuclease/phosphatase family metal-dependent hydrolase